MVTQENGEKKYNLMPRRLKILALVLAVVIISAGIGVWWWLGEKEDGIYLPPNDYPQPTDFIVLEGEPFLNNTLKISIGFNDSFYYNISLSSGFTLVGGDLTGNAKLNNEGAYEGTCQVKAIKTGNYSIGIRTHYKGAGSLREYLFIVNETDGTYFLGGYVPPENFFSDVHTNLTLTYNGTLKVGEIIDVYLSAMPSAELTESKLVFDFDLNYFKDLGKWQMEFDNISANETVVFHSQIELIQKGNVTIEGDFYYNIPQRASINGGKYYNSHDRIETELVLEIT